MNVLHLCLSSFFIDERAYQENELVEAHAQAGHSVTVLASTHVHDASGKRSFTDPGEYVLGGNIKVVRIPYHPWIPLVLGKSLRVHQGVYDLISEFAPDAILFHGMCGWELLTVARYKKNNPDVLFYVDTHTDFINSAKTPLSKWGLHYLFYRPIVHRCLPYIEKILCISKLTESFAKDFYDIPADKLEFYPLGGHPVPDSDYELIRNRIRSSMALEDKEVLFVQSGKQSIEKKLLETLEAFTQTKDSRFRLLIVGALLQDISDTAKQLIDSDYRVQFLGWKSPEELRDILCAADVYMQPGSQSATMQTSLCCYCAPVLADIEGHEIYTQDNGWLVNGAKDIKAVLDEISSERVSLQAKKEASKKLAKEMLDYSVLAERILH